jgi:hypothetical protein
METEKVIKQLKERLEKIYPDMEETMPVDPTPQSIERVKHMAAVASSDSMALALTARALAQYVKKKEAEITLKHIQARDLVTPKDDHLKALLKNELSEEYAYLDLCNRMLDICKQRVMLAQTFLRNAGKEDFAGNLEI